MLAEIGQFLLGLGLLTALCLSIIPLLGYFFKRDDWMLLARPLAYLQFVLVFGAFLSLVWLFVVQDFSVAYVWRNSNSLLPLRYRISAVWGAHEGSMLLWVTIQTIWVALVARFSHSLSHDRVARVLAVLGWVSLGFLAFVVFASNPFERLFPIPADGVDLNPLLQDIGLIIHPPILYAGYVGLSVPYAIAIAALLGGDLDEKWIRWSRPWTNAAWAFLTMGIVLGSWWAYYELGWGGWWFWDPVENASFMPWLAATALIHVQAVSERRNAFRGWTVLLSILAFSLSVLGTFLVRSGILTSVHAFASDPKRGIFVLALLGFYTGGGLLLYALRAHKIRSEPGFELSSRETLLLANSLIFLVATFTVLLGTLFPLLFDAFGKKISIGPPYFGLMFFLIMVPMVVLLPIGVMMRWHRDSFARVLRQLAPLFLLTTVLTIIVWWFLRPLPLKALAGVYGGIWLLVNTLYALLTQKGHLTRGRLGMHLAHLGVAFFVFGVSMTEHTDFEKDLLMNPGESATFKGYTFAFEGVQRKRVENYIAEEGTFTVYQNDKLVTVLHPQKREYPRQRKPMTEAAIDPGLTRDIYISLGEQLNDQGGWSVRIYIKPFIRWMWGGGLLMMLGGLLAATDRRYKRHAEAEKSHLASQWLKKNSGQPAGKPLEANP